jgi:hypothetical protein
VEPDPATTPDNNATDQGRAVSVAEAWKAVQDKLGEIKPEDNKAVLDAGGKLPTKEEPAKPAPKPEPEADEEPAATGNAQRDYVKGLAALRGQFERKHQKLDADMSARERAIQGAVQKYEPIHRAVSALLDSGDFDGFAEAISSAVGDDSIKTWNDLQQAALQSHGNPAIREVRKVKQQLAAKERADAAALEQARANQQAQAQQAQIRQWQETVSDEIASDEDPALPGLLEVDEDFAKYVFATQQNHYRQKNGEVLPTKAAAEQTLKGLYVKWQQWGEFFEKHKASPFVQKISGVQAADKKPAPGTGNRSAARQGNGQFQKKPAPNVSQNRTAEASATGRLSDAEIKRKWAREMEQAARSDPKFGMS